jgi:hypothetical protein
MEDGAIVLKRHRPLSADNLQWAGIIYAVVFAREFH